MYFLLGINAGMFLTILILSKFKMKRFLELGEEVVDILENKRRSLTNEKENEN